MFEMYKYILPKLSFDKKIFKKELLKAFTRLKDDERVELKNWCQITFDKNYNGLLEEVFLINENDLYLVQQDENTIAA
jgi:hypothetical protein